MSRIFIILYFTTLSTFACASEINTKRVIILPSIDDMKQANSSPVQTPLLFSTSRNNSPYSVSTTSSNLLVFHFHFDLGTTTLDKPILLNMDVYSNEESVMYPIGQITISGSPDFSITDDYCSGADIPGAQHCSYNVLFKPSRIGTQTATINIPFTAYTYLNDGSLDANSGNFINHMSAEVVEDEIKDNDSEHSCELAANSSINVDSLTLKENIPLVGIDFYLNYNSGRLRHDSDYNPTYLGLGGWTPSHVHFYDPSVSILFKGTGSKRQVTPTVINNRYIIASKDGKLIYEFSPQGQHVLTRDSKTNIVLYRFDYDNKGRFRSHLDQFGKSVLVHYYPNHTDISSAYGQLTRLTYDSFGYLSSIANPANEVYSMQNDFRGLLLKFKKPMGQESTVSYDQSGRVIQDIGAGGDLIKFSRYFDTTTRSLSIKKQTALGIVTHYSTFADGNNSFREVNSAHGASFNFSYEKEGTNFYQNSYGETFRSVQESDPRFSWMSPYAKQFRLSISGSPITISRNIIKSTIGLNPTDPRKFIKMETHTLLQENPNRIYQTSFDSNTQTQTTYSPEKRVKKISYNDKGLISSVAVNGLQPTKFSYDLSGHLTKVQQGKRVTKAQYDQYGRLNWLKDSTGRVTLLKYDKANRIIHKIGLHGKSILYDYDKNGNITSIKPMGKKTHSFSFNQMDLVSQYLPPELSYKQSTATSYSYNLDRQIEDVRYADGSALHYNYDPHSGLLKSIDSPFGSYSYTYPPSSRLIQSIISPDNVELNYDYFGHILKKINTSENNLLTNIVEYDYYSDASIKNITVSTPSGSSTIELEYDLDGLLIKSGALTLQRGLFGQISRTKLGNLESIHNYNSHGELTFEQYFFKNNLFYERSYKRDSLGRITSIFEKQLRKKHHIKKTSYKYDPNGRLSRVIKNRQTIRSYYYDSNGNRLLKKEGRKHILSHYDSQDRLIRSGKFRYEYNLRGDLKKVINRKSSKSFDYDLFGNLKAVYSDQNKKISYNVDGLNRRVRKKVNGQYTHGFIYQSQTKIIAEVDSINNISKHFIYAEKPNIPSYMIYNDKNYRIISDQVGTPKMIVDSETGNIVAYYEYDEFGILLKKNGSINIPFGFAGGLYDPETRLTRFGARDYDGTTGRWLSKDPILFNGGQFNLYSYALNDPINLIDMNGLTPADVNRIKNSYRRTVDNMTQNGRRLSDPIVNNLAWLNPFNDVKGCYGQAEEVANELNGDPNLQDNWSITREGHNGPFPHYWVDAINNTNPNESIRLDPWYDAITPLPK